MSAKSEDTTTVIAEFLALPWHDSKLLGFCVDSSRAIVRLEVQLRADNSSERRELRFIDARGVYADVDLLAKRLCSHHIASGFCEKAEESKEVFVQRINERFDLIPGETTDGLHVFGLTLIPPSGEFLVLAKSFSLEVALAEVARTGGNP